MQIYLKRTIKKLQILEKQFNESKNPVYRFGILASILNELKECHDEIFNNPILYKGMENRMLEYIDKEFEEKWKKEGGN